MKSGVRERKRESETGRRKGVRCRKLGRERKRK